MLFNSLSFLIFLPVVFCLYWFVFSRYVRLQNIAVIVSSYIFYGWWDLHFLLLISFTGLCCWVSALGVQKGGTIAKWLTITNVIVNLGILCVFKYYNFFMDSFVAAFASLGIQLHVVSIQFILPVGISFYTFQALSYSLDVYKGKLQPTKDITTFFAYISFFPQLLAGPIARATALLPQFQQKRIFEYSKVVDGLRQILWGFFKKFVVADNCAKIVDLVFADYTNYSGGMLALGAVLFTFQIYCDFSGYSDIALGIGRLFGINLMCNFNFPYFSRDIAEFWRRWHISLTTWFREYIYFPLGGSREGQWKSIRNTSIVFLVSGLWHGANWTFIVWGAYHAFLFLPLLLLKKNRKHISPMAEGKLFPSLGEFVQMSITFVAVTFGWIIFKSDSITHAFYYISGIFNLNFFDFSLHAVKGASLVIAIFAVVFLMTVEWVQRDRQYALENLGLQWKRPLRWTFYAGLLFLIGMYMETSESPFIYFQF